MMMLFNPLLLPISPPKREETRYTLTRKEKQEKQKKRELRERQIPQQKKKIHRTERQLEWQRVRAIPLSDGKPVGFVKKNTPRYKEFQNLPEYKAYIEKYPPKKTFQVEETSLPYFDEKKTFLKKCKEFFGFQTNEYTKLHSD
jgi:hypothetical protein